MSDFINKLDNRMNPIVVKELRQGLQSQFIIIVVNLLLVALSGAYLLTIMLNPSVMDDATGGQMLFAIFQGILVLATSIGVPIYLIARLCAERNDTNVDLFFTTTLSPHQIVRGKFIAGMTLVTLLYSICLPFMLCTNLLRGFDIPTMLGMLLINYSMVSLVVMLAIAIGCWSLPRILTPFIIVGSLFFLLLFNLIFAQSSIGFLFVGVQVSFRGNMVPLLAGFAIYLFILFLGIKILGALATGLLAPPASNRTYYLRFWSSISIAAMLFILLLCMSIIAMSDSGSWDDAIQAVTTSMIAWISLSTLLICFVMFVAMCEPDGFSRRIMKDRPEDPRRRLIAFLYTYGASGGFAWAVVHALVVWGIVVLGLFLLALSDASYLGDSLSDSLAWSVMFFCTTACYILLTKGLMRTIFEAIPTKFAWAFYFALSTLLPIAMMLFCFILDTSDWTDNMLWKLFLPPAFGIGREDVAVRVMLSIIGAAIMLVTAIPRVLCDLENYIAGRFEVFTDSSATTGPIMATIVTPEIATLEELKPESPFAEIPIAEETDNEPDQQKP